MTIYALSTGSGISGIAVIRVSGTKSKDILKWDERLQEYKSSNQLISAILSQITKDTNAFEISIIISKEFKIDQEQALYYAKNIITKIKKDLNSI